MVDERCIKCFLRTYERLFEKYNVSERHQGFFLSFFNHIVKGNYTNFAPEIQRNLNRTFCRLIGMEDPFSQEKEDSNRIALELYDEWKPKVIESNNPFNLALKLAIAGNIMDYGASTSFDIHKTIDSVLQSNFAIDKSKELKQRLLKAKQVLYLGDNAGEIVFDKLFIETTQHGNITYAVKGAPVLNDVTMDDANQVNMHCSANVISNGYDAPSTILSHCSDEFLKIYNSADLIISKGQGNLEGLLDTKDPRIFFLLMVKCDLIAEILKVKKDDFVVHSFS